MSRKKKLDFSNVEDFVKCEEGQHVVVLRELEEKETQNGDDMLLAKFEVVKGNSTGARIFDNFVLTEKALWKFKGFLTAIGKKADAKIVIDLDELIGKRCIAEVAHEEYNGTNRAKIAEFKKLAKAADPDDEDEEDDDEDDEPTPPKKPSKPAPKPEKKKPKPEPEYDEDEDEEEEDEEPAPKKKPSKPEPKSKPAPSKSKKKPEPEDDDEDEDDDWEE